MTPSETQKARSRLRQSLRRFYNDLEYDEVDTPIIVECPGTEVFLRYFPTEWTDQKNQSHPKWLRTSPELHMKQLLCTGMEKIYQLGPCYRNHGERSPWHHPEFTMLEWYRTNISVEDFLAETATMLSTTASDLGNESLAQAASDYTKLPFFDLFEEATGVTLVDGDPALGNKLNQAGVLSIEASDDFETALYKAILLKLDPFLERFDVAVVVDFPPSQAALAQIEDNVAKRFEFYVKGHELSNGFCELTDPAENRDRFIFAQNRRKELGFEVPSADEFFFSALASAMPDACGNALGFDRWLALILAEQDIGNVIPFRDQTLRRGPE